LVVDWLVLQPYYTSASHQSSGAELLRDKLGLKSEMMMMMMMMMLMMMIWSGHRVEKAYQLKCQVSRNISLD